MVVGGLRVEIKGCFVMLIVRIGFDGGGLLVLEGIEERVVMGVFLRF